MTAIKYINLAAGCAVLGLASLLGATAGAADGGLVLKSVEGVLALSPLPAEAPVQVSWTALAGNSQVLVMEVRKIVYHHHDVEDHIVYVARGKGTLRLENGTRDIAEGDIIVLPHGVKHGFERSGDENLVILVTGTPGFEPVAGIIADE